MNKLIVVYITSVLRECEVLSGMIEKMVNHRLVCFISICIYAYYFYSAAYVLQRPSSHHSYSVLFSFAVGGSIVSLYVLEKSDSKFGEIIGYLGLYAFLLIGIGGVVFGW